MKYFVLLIFALKLATVGAVLEIQSILSALILFLAIYSFYDSYDLRNILIRHINLSASIIYLTILFLCMWVVVFFRGMNVQDAQVSFLKYLMFPSCIFLGIYSTKKFNWVFVYRYIITLTTLILIFSVLQFYFGGGYVEIGGAQRLTGFVSEADLISNLASLTLLLSISGFYNKVIIKDKKYIFYVSILLAMLVLILSATLKNIFITTVFSLIFLILDGRIKVKSFGYIFILLPGILYFVDISSLQARLNELLETGLYVASEGEYLGNSMNWRALQWSLALSDWYDNYFFFGSGLGQIVNMNVLQTDEGTGYSAHNDYVSFLAEFGLVGFFLFIVIHIYIYKIIKRETIVPTALVLLYGMLASCAFFGPVFYTIPWLYVLPFLIGSNLK